jgi:hypothetical protein
MPPCCVLVFSSLFIDFVCVCVRVRWAVSLTRGLCWFILGVAVGVPRATWCSTVGLPNVSQAGLETASDGVAALLFSQCYMA